MKSWPVPLLGAQVTVKQSGFAAPYQSSYGKLFYYGKAILHILTSSAKKNRDRKMKIHTQIESMDTI
jgi:hypothetical protein